MEFNYRCIHEHANGHVMRLMWGEDPERVELYVNFPMNIVSVNVDGVQRDKSSIEGMSIEMFESLIEECETCYQFVRNSTPINHLFNK